MPRKAPKKIVLTLRRKIQGRYLLEDFIRDARTGTRDRQILSPIPRRPGPLARFSKGEKAGCPILVAFSATGWETGRLVLLLSPTCLLRLPILRDFRSVGITGLNPICAAHGLELFRQCHEIGTSAPAIATSHTPAPPHPPPPRHRSSSPHPETAPPDALCVPAFPNGLACRDSVRFPAAHAH